jgi:serine/threonine protein kinase
MLNPYSPDASPAGSFNAGEMMSFRAPFDRPERTFIIEFTELTASVFGHRYDSRTDTLAALDQLSNEAQRNLLENLLGAASRFTVATEGMEGDRRRSRRATLHAALQTLDVAQQRRLTLRLLPPGLEDDKRVSLGARSEQFSRPASPQRVKMTHDLELTEDEDGDLLLSINHYSILDVLGRGSQGTVYLAFDEALKEFRAIKAVKKPMETSESMRQLQAEVKIMMRLRHPNIVALHEVINPPQSKTLYLVMQYVEKGPIVEYTDDTQTTCKPHPPGPFVYTAKQLLSALQYLHKRKIYHQDIKPENILCGLNDQVYLSDFGVAQTFRDERSHNPITPISLLTHRPSGSTSPRSGTESADCILTRHHSTSGTPAFFPPEKLSILEEDEAKPEIDLAAADVWALGVSFYFLLTGAMPFRTGEILTRKSSAMQDLLKSESSDFAAYLAEARIEFPDDTPECWRILLAAMLEKDPAHRIRLREAASFVERIDPVTLVVDEEGSPKKTPSLSPAKAAASLQLDESLLSEARDKMPKSTGAPRTGSPQDNETQSLPTPMPPPPRVSTLPQNIFSAMLPPRDTNRPVEASDRHGNARESARGIRQDEVVEPIPISPERSPETSLPPLFPALDDRHSNVRSPYALPQKKKKIIDDVNRGQDSNLVPAPHAPSKEKKVKVGSGAPTGTLNSGDTRSRGGLASSSKR